ncbi:MAG: DUF456 family protein [Planctomycetales bacterium]|nr:DUF456 family protein [Planctomycetales bacterium]NIM10082.1 DUF456 family protein [Planctomycetales bacterium]NIN09525.1 DUF456 family protein [Planctomycetales bacterium]NIN78635.1 DUF456 family protein [Planctomycetales bacterium]NIO35829.1 DUF456 family protein [Planctomycetales bacterium]
MTLLWPILLVLLLIALWTLNIFGVPGNWLVLLATVVYAYLVPDAWVVDVGWLAIGVMVCLALLGEAIELLASAVGVHRYGGTRRGAVLALVGALVGSVTGLFLGVPVPIVGPILGAIFFAAVGATCGAVLGEKWAGRKLSDSCKVGMAAFFGRLVGTAGKMVAGAVMIAVAVAAVALEMF